MVSKYIKHLTFLPIFFFNPEHQLGCAIHPKVLKHVQHVLARAKKVETTALVNSMSRQCASGQAGRTRKLRRSLVD